MESITLNLSFAGSQITDDDMILYALDGLGSEFEFVVVNVTSRRSPICLAIAINED